VGPADWVFIKSDIPFLSQTECHSRSLKVELTDCLGLFEMLNGLKLWCSFFILCVHSVIYGTGFIAELIMER
jgi:hypothetical protein